MLRVLDLYCKVAIFELKLRKCTSRTDLYHNVAIFELELRKCTSRTRLALQSCDFRAGAAEGSALRVLDLCATKLGFSIWSCESVLRVARLVLQSCFFLSRSCQSSKTL